MSRYSKLWAALATAIAVTLTTTLADSETVRNVLLIVEAFLGALGVYAAPNAPPVVPGPRG